ncbi:MAG: hypothetical protein K0S78_4552 [Thermomicrobiales bacterium]|nr:hypothetical protein [Thermomicrobiales bacterium]
MVGLAATCGTLEGVPNNRDDDLPGLIAAIHRDAERNRPELLEEKMARARAPGTESSDSPAVGDHQSQGHGPRTSI